MLASSSDFAKALSSLTLYPGGSSSTSSLSSPYPPILLINGYVGLLVNPPTPYVITRTTLISGPVDSSSSGLGGAPADAAVLDLNSGQNVISVQTTLFLQRIMIVNPIILQLPSSGSSAVQRSALPLYAFSGDRTTGYFLQLSMATLQLSSEDFVQIYTIASKGVAWKSGSDLGTNLLVQGTDTFDVTSYNCSYVRLGLYSGWGLNASDFLIVPDNPSKACALIIPTTNNSPVVPLQGSSSSSPSPSSSSAVAIGVGVGVGVGVLLLVLAGAFFYVKYWRGDKSKRYGRAVNFASTSADPAEMEDSPGELMVNGRLVEGAAIAGGSDNASRASGSRAMGASSYANPYGAPSTVLTGGGSVNQGIDLWKQLYDASNLGMNEEGGFEGGKEGEDAANAFIAVAKASNYHAAIVEESIDTLAPGNRSEGGNVISAIGKHQERLLNHQGSSMSTAEGGNGSLTALSGDARPTGTSGDDGTSAAQLPLVSESSKSSVPTKAPKSSFDPHKAVASIAKELRENEANKLQLLEPIGQGGFGTGRSESPSSPLFSSPL